MCEPKPITLSRICVWKPVTMATETSITANPKAMLKMAIRTIGREKLSLFPERMRRAIKSSVFNGDYRLEQK